MMLLDFDKSLLEMRDSKKRTALHVLANMPHIFESGYVKGFWAELIYDCNNVLPSLFSTMIKKFKNYISFLFFFFELFYYYYYFSYHITGIPMDNTYNFKFPKFFKFGQARNIEDLEAGLDSEDESFGKFSFFFFLFSSIYS